jgi:hypothetical protein
VYVTVPGKHQRQYFGLYELVENIDENFAEDRFGTDKGAIFKPVTPNMFADLGDDWKAYKQPYDPKTKVTEAQKRRIIDLCKLVTHADDARFAAGLGKLIDLGETARYMAALVFLSDTDSILGTGQNFYLYLDPKSDRLKFIPWDHDHSFGQFPFGGSQADRENLSIHHPWVGKNRFLERVYQVEAFKKAYLASLSEMSRTLFRPERFAAQVDEIAAAIRPAVAAESGAKLARFNKAVAGELLPAVDFGGPPPPPDGQDAKGGPGRPGRPGPPPGGSPPPQPRRPRSGASEPVKGPGPTRPTPPIPMIKPVKPYVKARLRSVADQLAGKSAGKAPGAMSFGGPGEGEANPEENGPGNFLGPLFMASMDADRDKQLTREEAVSGFAQWFGAWDADRSGDLTDEELRAGIDKAFAFPGGPPDPGANKRE